MSVLVSDIRKVNPRVVDVKLTRETLALYCVKLSLRCCPRSLTRLLWQQKLKVVEKRNWTPGMKTKKNNQGRSPRRVQIRSNGLLPKAVRRLRYNRPVRERTPTPQMSSTRDPQTAGNQSQPDTLLFPKNGKQFNQEKNIQNMSSTNGHERPHCICSQTVSNSSRSKSRENPLFLRFGHQP